MVNLVLIETGGHPIGQTVLINPASFRLPDGTLLGDYHGANLPPQWIPTRSLPDYGAGMSHDYTLQDAQSGNTAPLYKLHAENQGLLGTIPDGALIHWKVYGAARLQWNYTADFKCLFFDGGDLFIQEGYSVDLPAINTLYIQEGTICTNIGDPLEDTVSVPANVSNFNQPLVFISGPRIGDRWLGRFLAQSCYVVVKGYRLEGDTEDREVPPVELPGPPVLPAGLPIPDTIPRAEPPVLSGGVIKQETGGTGTPTLDKQSDGTYHLNATIDCGDCPGSPGSNGIDGVDGVDGVNGLNGTNGLDGTNGTNGIDGIDGVGTPGADLMLIERRVDRNVLSPLTGQIEVRSTPVWVHADGIHDSGSLYDEIFQMLRAIQLEVRYPIEEERTLGTFGPISDVGFS